LSSKLEFFLGADGHVK